MKLSVLFVKLLKLSMFLFAILSISSCSTTLKLPPETQNMETVYLLKYSTWGHHSLAFYDDGRFTEFTYGDWDLFALNMRDGWTAWKNKTFPTQGALGRKAISLYPGDSICDKFTGCETVVLFYPPTDKVKTLQIMLQNKYDANILTEVFNSKEDVYFVKHEEPYWVFHNCNHQLIEWLESLGVMVYGRVFYKPLLTEGMEPKLKPIVLLP
jgi:hypothetical protein